jgi:hypothetical protein
MPCRPSVRNSPEGHGWWEYFGSFGDDIFGDVEADA